MGSAESGETETNALLGTLQKSSSNEKNMFAHLVLLEFPYLGRLSYNLALIN